MGAYSKNTWIARTGTGLNRYTDQNSNVLELTPAPTELITPGTPFSADWMNHIEQGIYDCSLNVTGYGISDQSSATIVLSIPACENVPLVAGQVFVINFQSQPFSNATLNINGTGAKPIFNAYPYAAIVEGDIPPGYVAFIAYDGTNYVVLNRAWQGPSKPTGSQFFTSSGTFTVPAEVYAINVSACAAGVGIYAGEWIVDTVYQVSPGDQIAITVGSGNTVIGSLATLTAGSKSESMHCTKLGYATGYNGGLGGGNTSGYGGYGYGGAFGYGGGGGASGFSGSDMAGGGGGGKGGDGGLGDIISPGTGGGSSGGSGGRNSAGANAREGTIVNAGGSSTGMYSGGGGSVFGAGGGGGAKAGTGIIYGGCGGGAGGYGGGGGNGGEADDNTTAAANGSPSPGCVLIEWGPTYG